VWLGWQWLESGWEKINNPAWMQTGAAVKGFWERAIVVPETGRAPVAYDWHRAFLQVMLEGGHYTWFAKLVVIGELAVGIALILGLLIGIAAFAGVFMNWHFVMAGAASTNAMLALVGSCWSWHGGPPAGGVWIAGFSPFWDCGGGWFNLVILNW
jgi:thiosulfate dehydrogenase [quinone] large subunit